MRTLKYIIAVASLIGISTFTLASERHQQRSYDRQYAGVSHSKPGHNRSYRKGRNKYSKRHDYSYNRSGDHGRYNQRPHASYNKRPHNYQRPHTNYNKRPHRNYKPRPHGYNNYQPYNNYEYRYRPVRGLGHYYSRQNYGYGHWHDSSWCVTVHPNSYYSNYYANYPHHNGWRFGDGNFGIWFNL
ncbi:MAG: hypothetical protein L3J52_00350 [Proteobacteria bacterium]|nr:hypothetical protein [Pseudomonadota bacterium]